VSSYTLYINNVQEAQLSLTNRPTRCLWQWPWNRGSKLVKVV